MGTRMRGRHTVPQVRRIETMKAIYSTDYNGVLRARFNPQRFLRDSGSFIRFRRALLMLMTTGVILFLWAAPVEAAPTITEFHVSSAGVPQGIASGPDGNLWFTEFYDNVVGRISPKGNITLFSLKTSNS